MEKAMKSWSIPNSTEVQERIAALQALGHTGEAEKHSRRALQSKETYGLVYEKTARALLGDLSQKRFRELVLPDRWIGNPVYSTAPRVPVYEPRWLLAVREMIESNNAPALDHLREFTAARRKALDDEIRAGYAEFFARAKRWAAVREERRRLR
jgi:hypothetical protein